MRAVGSALTSHFRDGRQNLPEIEPLRQLSRSVYAVLGMNPGPFALTGTNTYLVGTGPKRILIDTGEGKPEYMVNLERAMQTLGATGLQEIVVTHWHHDHLGGVPSVVARYGDVPVRKFMPEAAEDVYGGEGSIDPYSVWPRERFAPLADGETLRTEGATLRVLHTPGHANDHVVLIHMEEQAMFTGDNVLGVGTSFFRDLGEYVASLERMHTAAISDGLRTLYPAHGPVILDAAGKLEEYIAHRRERIDQVRAALEGAPPEGLTCVEVARRLYAEVSESLIPAAASNTLQALLKLERDGAAVRCGGGAPPEAGVSGDKTWAQRWALLGGQPPPSKL